MTRAKRSTLVIGLAALAVGFVRWRSRTRRDYGRL
jgi:hypothetical protein